VISLFRDHVASDVLVTVQAQSALGASVEAYMTLLAVGLELGMAGNHLARHDDAFHGIGLRHGAQQDKSQHQSEEGAAHGAGVQMD
jgi:hypothetical protein